MAGVVGACTKGEGRREVHVLCPLQYVVSMLDPSQSATAMTRFRTYLDPCRPQARHTSVYLRNPRPRPHPSLTGRRSKRGETHGEDPTGVPVYSSACAPGADEIQIHSLFPCFAACAHPVFEGPNCDPPASTFTPHPRNPILPSGERLALQKSDKRNIYTTPAHTLASVVEPREAHPCDSQADTTNTTPDTIAPV